MKNKDFPTVEGHWLYGCNGIAMNNPISLFLDEPRQHGDYFRANMKYQYIYITSNADIFKYILQTNQKNYKKDIAYQQLRLALGNGLLTSEGAFWKKQRKLSQPAFYKTQLEILYREMVNLTKQFLEELEHYKKEKKRVDMSQLMMGVTADIAMKTLFSSEMKSSKKEVYESMNGVQDYVMKRLRQPFRIPLMYVNGEYRNFKNRKKVFDDNIYSMIEDRRQSGEVHPDLLSMLMNSVDAETGERMSDEQLRDEVITIFAAGHETSANALSWTFYLLSQHPEVVKKLRTEVAEVLGDRTPGFNELRNLKYTKQVLDESMRLYPPAWAIGRECLADDVLLGHPIKKGTATVMSVLGLHRNPKYWKDPEAFDPERFTAERVKERPKFHYLPFGAGPRMCIGNHFAMMEMQLLLSMIIRRFDFVLDESQEVVMDALVTLRPKFGVWGVVQ